eukprot:Hpha_TRINITY_DN23516_c0_g1::TRINITY_DN23516_c0_g1_i1::g.186478::m.186478
MPDDDAERRAQGAVTRISPAVRSTFVTTLPPGLWSQLTWQEREGRLRNWLDSEEGRRVEREEGAARTSRRVESSQQLVASGSQTMLRQGDIDSEAEQWKRAVEKKAQEWSTLIEGENVALRVRVSQLEHSLREAVARRRQAEERAAGLQQQLTVERGKREVAEKEVSSMRDRRDKSPSPSACGAILPQFPVGGRSRDTDSPPRPSLFRSVGVSQRQVSSASQRSVSGGGGVFPSAGLMQENASLRRMVGYIRGQLHALDGKQPNTSAAGGAANAPPAPIADIRTWSSDLQGWSDFLQRPSHSAFAIGPLTADGRSWGAAWGKDTHEEAAAEAIAACRVRCGEGVLIWPPPATDPLAPANGAGAGAVPKGFSVL